MTLVRKPLAEAIARRTRDLYIASFSDVHLGHPQTPTSLIIQNLRKAFPNTAATGELDLILLGGDLFDEGMMYSDEDIFQIEGWMLSFLRTCERFNIVLRVLEGTPSHDRKQSRHFEKLIEQHEMKLDFKYVTKVSVEKIEALGVTMLYVPDFTLPEADKIWLMVQQAMAEAGVTSVDYANIHGSFQYQMPEIERVQNACLSMEQYLSIVDNYIWSGHIHISSVYGGILCNGSFDRLAHGEEEDKGHWRSRIRKNGEDDHVFSINADAKLYKSVHCAGLEAEAAMAAVDAMAKSLPPESAIRVVGTRGQPVLANVARLKQDYPLLYWSTKSVDTRDVQKNLLVDMRDSGLYKEIAITPENVTGLLMERVRAKCDNQAVVNRCAELLGDYVS